MTKKEIKAIIKLLVIIFLGYLGIHKFIEKDTKMGWIYLFTVGLFGFGWLIDIIKAIIELCKLKSSKETSVTNNTETNYSIYKNNTHKFNSRRISKEEILERKPNEFILFDSETTGLSPDDGDRIIEFCFLKYKDNVIVDKLTALVNPGCSLPLKIIDLTGINNDDLIDKQPMQNHIKEIVNFINNQIVIGHNIPFDLKFLSSEIKRCDFKVDDVNIEYIDTLDLARSTIYLENHKLETLKYYLGFQTNSHRAEADCETAYEVYKYCLNMLIEDKIREQKRKQEQERIQKERMLNITDDEKEIIDYFIEVAQKHKKEIKYTIKSDKSISFTLLGIEIGKIKYNGTKRFCRLFAGDNESHEWENAENPSKEQIKEYIEDLFIYVDSEYEQYFLIYKD